MSFADFAERPGFVRVPSFAVFFAVAMVSLIWGLSAAIDEVSFLRVALVVGFAAFVGCLVSIPVDLALRLVRRIVRRAGAPYMDQPVQ